MLFPSHDPIVAVFPSDQTANDWVSTIGVTATNFKELIQVQPYSRVRTLQNKSLRTKIVHTMSVAKLDGFRPEGVNYIADTSSAISTNYRRYWIIAGATWDDDITLNVIKMRVKIWYYIRFFRRKTLALS